MGHRVKVQSTKVVDLVTGMMREAHIDELLLDKIEQSVTAVVWSTGCPVYDRVPWLLGRNSSRVLGWQELVEPGSFIVLAESPQKHTFDA